MNCDTKAEELLRSAAALRQLLRSPALFFLFLAIECFACVCLLREAAAQPPGENWDRGPISLGEQFPLALYHSSFFAESPAVLPEGEFGFRSGFAWSNTINRKGQSYLIDAETRVGFFEASYSPLQRWEIGVHLPVIWQSGGSLDSFINGWHSFFGLPEGPRDDSDIEDDSFTIEAEQTDGSLYEENPAGASFGDLELRSKFLLTEGDAERPAIALSGRVRLPSGASSFGSSGTDFVLMLLAAKRWESITLYTGLGYSYYSDIERHGLRFQQHRGGGFVGLEWRAFDPVSFFVGLQGGSNLIANLERFPDYQVYLDLGGKISLGSGFVLELLLRENPAPDQGTTDVTFFTAVAFTPPL